MAFYNRLVNKYLLEGVAHMPSILWALEIPKNKAEPPPSQSHILVGKDIINKAANEYTRGKLALGRQVRSDDVTESDKRESGLGTVTSRVRRGGPLQEDVL